MNAGRRFHKVFAIFIGANFFWYSPPACPTVAGGRRRRVLIIPEPKFWLIKRNIQINWKQTKLFFFCILTTEERNREKSSN